MRGEAGAGEPPPGGVHLQPVRAAPPELVERFHLSHRLATRVAALLAEGLGLTATVIEVAGDPQEGAVLRSLLLLPELVADASSLTPLCLEARMDRARAAVPGGQYPDLALTTDARGQTLLCLSEELLALRAWDLAGDLAPPLVPVEPGGALAHRRPPAGLAAADEIVTLERTFRVAAEPARRIEALNTLVALSPILPEHRTALLLEALASPDPEVARGAAGLLEPAGLPRELASALEELEHRSPRRRAHALDQLRTTVGAEAPDPVTCAAVLLVTRRVLRSEPEPRLRRELVLLLGESTRGAVASEANVAEVVRTLVQASVDEPAAMSLPVRRAVLRLSGAHPGATSRALWREAAQVSDDRVAVYVLALLGELPLAPDEEARFCEELVRRAQATPGEDLNLAQLEVGLSRRGELGLDTLLPLLDQVRPEDQADLLRCIDRVAQGLDPRAPAVRRAQARLVQHLRLGSPASRVQALDTRLVAVLPLPGKLASEAVTRFLQDMRLYLLPEVFEQTVSSLARHGRHVVLPVQQFLQDPELAPDLATRTLELLAAASAATGRGLAFRHQELRSSAASLVRLFENRPALRGAAAAAAGKLTVAPAASRALALTLTRNLRRLVKQLERESPGAAAPELDLFLCGLAQRPDLPAREVDRLERHFLGCLDPSLDPGLTLRLVEGAVDQEADHQPDLIYESDGAERHHTMRIPTAIQGLAALARSSPEGRTFRRRYLHLHRLATRVLGSDQLVWGPFTIALLVRELASLAQDPRATPGVRKLFLESLAAGEDLLHPELGHLPVVEAVPEVLRTSPAELRRAHGLTLLERLASARRERPGFSEQEEVLLLDAACRVACLEELQPTRRRREALTRLLRRLEVARREGLPVGCATSWLARSPHLTRQQLRTLEA